MMFGRKKKIKWLEETLDQVEERVSFLESTKKANVGDKVFFHASGVEDLLEGKVVDVYLYDGLSPNGRYCKHWEYIIYVGEHRYTVHNARIVEI